VFFLNLYLFHTSGCHLCELAEAEVAVLPKKFTFNLILSDIADSDTLMQRYDVRIPVLKLEGCVQDLGWPFTVDDIATYLERHA
jgi:hypothetical protein